MTNGSNKGVDENADCRKKKFSLNIRKNHIDSRIHK